MSRVFDDKFQGGYEETWSGGETLSGSATLVEGSANSGIGSPNAWGTQSLKMVRGDGEFAFVRDDHGSGVNACYNRLEFYVEAEGFANGEQTFMGTLESSSGTVMVRNKLWQTAGGAFRWLVQVLANGSSFTTISTNISTGTKYRGEIEWNTTANTWEVRLDDTTLNSGTLTGSAATTPIQQWTVGSSATGNGDCTVWFDNFAIDDATWVGPEYDVTPTALVGTWAVQTPSVTQTLTVTPSALDAVWNQPAASGTLGGLTVTPAAVDAAWAAVAPSVTLGGLTGSPSALSAVWNPVTGSVTLGGLTVTPTALTALWARVNGSVTFGGLTVTPSALDALWAAQTPTGTLGGLTVTPDALAAVWSEVTGSASLGTLTVTPDALDAIWGLISGVASVPITGQPDALASTWAVVPGTATIGGLTVTPSALDAVWSELAGVASFGTLTINAPSPLGTTRELHWAVVNPRAAGDLTPHHKGGKIVYLTDGIHLAVIGKPTT